MAIRAREESRTLREQVLEDRDVAMAGGATDEEAGGLRKGIGSLKKVLSVVLGDYLPGEEAGSILGCPSLSDVGKALTTVVCALGAVFGRLGLGSSDLEGRTTCWG